MSAGQILTDFVVGAVANNFLFVQGNRNSNRQSDKPNCGSLCSVGIRNMSINLI